MIPAIDAVDAPRHDCVMSGRRVVVVAFDGVQMLDVVGPIEVFSVANRLDVDPGYSVEVVANLRGTVTTSSGLVLGVGDRQRPGVVDTLIVAGGLGVRDARHDAHLGRAVVRLAEEPARGRRLHGFASARRSRIARRRARVTHWASCDHLAERYQAVTVEPDPIYVRDGNVWTSAGVTAGMDLALALVAEDHGASVAREVAQLARALPPPAGRAVAVQRPSRRASRRA